MTEGSKGSTSETTARMDTAAHGATADAETRDVHFELNLAQGEASTDEMRAEKLPSIGDTPLRLYHALNLGPGLWIVVGGNGLVVGLAVVAETMYLIVDRLPHRASAAAAKLSPPCSETRLSSRWLVS